MLQKASNEGWKLGYKPRQKAIFAVPCTSGSEPHSGAPLLLQQASCLLAPRPPRTCQGLLGLSQQLCWKWMHVKGEGERKKKTHQLNTHQQFSSEHLRKPVAFFLVWPTSFLLPGLLARLPASPASEVRGENSTGGRRRPGCRADPRLPCRNGPARGHLSSAGRWVAAASPAVRCTARDPQEKAEIEHGQRWKSLGVTSP